MWCMVNERQILTFIKLELMWTETTSFRNLRLGLSDTNSTCSSQLSSSFLRLVAALFPFWYVLFLVP